MKLVIDRSIWLRGETAGGSCLHRSYDGKMCCLGMLLEQAGVPKAHLTNREGPGDLYRFRVNREAFPAGLEWLVDHGVSSAAAFELMRVNDAMNMPASEREKQIAKRFAERGIEVEFIDGPGTNAARKEG